MVVILCYTNYTILGVPVGFSKVGRVWTHATHATYAVEAPMNRHRRQSGVCAGLTCINFNKAQVMIGDILVVLVVRIPKTCMLDYISVGCYPWPTVLVHACQDKLEIHVELEC